jgi:hypothetical protein
MNARFCKTDYGQEPGTQGRLLNVPRCSCEVLLWTGFDVESSIVGNLFGLRRIFQSFGGFMT